MEFNYPIVGVILLIAVLIIFALIRRNKKDQKNFEKSINESEMEPEQHKDVEPF